MYTLIPSKNVYITRLENHRFNAFLVALWAFFIRLVILVLGCFFFSVLSCLESSLLYLLLLRFLGLDSGISLEANMFVLPFVPDS